MSEIEKILERLKHNEEVAQKFFNIEISILSIFNFKDLIDRLLSEIEENFEITTIWLSLVNELAVADMVRDLAESDTLSDRFNLIDKDFFLNLIEDSLQPLLINNDFSAVEKILPTNFDPMIHSVAVVPLTLNNEIIGSLNLGDISEVRYAPGMDTTMLQRLAVKVSICLTNVAAQSMIKILNGLLPICASCKKIRDDEGSWNQIESYIRDHSEAEFSHGICPDCAKRLYPEFID